MMADPELSCNGFILGFQPPTPSPASCLQTHSPPPPDLHHSTITPNHHPLLFCLVCPKLSHISSVSRFQPQAPPPTQVHKCTAPLPPPLYNICIIPPPSHITTPHCFTWHAWNLETKEQEQAQMCRFQHEQVRMSVDGQVRVWTRSMVDCSYLFIFILYFCTK